MAMTHRGAGVLFTDPERAHFLLQQKDERYRPHPLGMSVFGGAVEPEESPRDAVLRELEEELPAAREALGLAPSLRSVFFGELGAAPYQFDLFEAVLPEETLRMLTRAPLFEGKAAVLVPRNALREQPWIYALGEAIARYLAPR